MKELDSDGSSSDSASTGGTSTSPTSSETERLTHSYDSDEEIYELSDMKLEGLSLKEDSPSHYAYDVMTNEPRKSSASTFTITNKMKAVIFINIFCVFDTADNINAKSAMVKGVDFLDLTLSRITLNFVSACFFVYFCQQKIFAGVPKEFTCALSYRSVMMLVG